MGVILLVMFGFFGTHLTFAESKDIEPEHIVLPDGKGGTGFDDMEFASGLGKVLVPGGRTGNLYLIDPRTLKIEIINGFSIDQGYHGGHGQSITSADEGSDMIFIADRDTQKLHAFDLETKTILASASLASKPDYVRYITSTNEVWVTQPSSEQIEVFNVSKHLLSHEKFITVPGGPESLVEDKFRQQVYTHLWERKTVVIDAQTHAITNEWPNGCEGSRGIALDEKNGFLFVGCEEGKAIVLDVNNSGKQLGALKTGSGVDIISYNAKLSHLYLAGSDSATLSILGISKKGEPVLLGVEKAANGSHCVTGDNRGNIWVCDPQHGQLLLYKDRF